MHLTIYVLGFGELFEHVLNAIVTFMNQSTFTGLLRITALIGIVMAAIGYLKTRDPMAFGKWFVAYVFFCNFVLLPKVNVQIFDITAEKAKIVANVPVVFALPASLITSIGFGLAQQYDSLLSMPDEFKYTQTGMLFGSRLVQAARDFHIVDSQLKEEMNHYFRSCVVGDIRLNRKYSMSDIKSEQNIWQLISAKASPFRMVAVNGKLVTCQEASRPSGEYSLKAKLDREIAKAHSFFGASLFSRPATTAYEELFNKQLTHAFAYYHGLTSDASNIFLQSMMMNAINNGVEHYQAYTDSAAIVNQQVSKAQLQHRWSWAFMGVKAVWFLPLMHTLGMLLLFGIFPLIVALATLPNGIRIMHGYLQYFISLQFWPLLYAILNAAMTFVGGYNSPEYNMVNLDKIDEMHTDLAGVAGYLMLLIPFICNGLVSNLREAFGSTATSTSSHLQGSAMQLGGETANASFNLGQTVFYNASANNVSANKHDLNFTNMHGMHAEQLSTGTVKTTTDSGDTVYDATPGMTRGAVGIHDVKSLNSSLHKAFEETQAATINESQAVQTATSNLAHEAIQFSTLDGKDVRLGEGVSETESGQMQQAVSNMVNIASEVGKRLGVSTDKALTDLMGAHVEAGGGIDSEKSIFGKAGKVILGASAKGSSGTKIDLSGTTSDRFNDNTDSGRSAKEAQDFHESFNFAQNFLKNHHFDEAHSKGASLASHMGADLRKTEQATTNLDAAKSRGERIQSAISYAESNSDNINADLSQNFVKFVSAIVGDAERDRLFKNPGDARAIQKLQSLGHDFLHNKREALIAAQDKRQGKVDSFYQQGAQEVAQKSANLLNNYQQNKANISLDGQKHDVGLSQEKVDQFKQRVDGNLNTLKQETAVDAQKMQAEYQNKLAHANKTIAKGKEKATRKPSVPDLIYKKKEEEEQF